MTQLDTTFRLEVDDDTVTCVRVMGELDVSTAPQLRECLHQLYLSGQRRVVLDLAELDFIDSTGIGVMVGALKRFRDDDGDVALRSPNRLVQKVLELTCLDRVFILA